MQQIMIESGIISPRTAKETVHPDGILANVPVDVETLDLRAHSVRLALAAHQLLSTALQPFGCENSNLSNLITAARKEKMISHDEMELLHKIRRSANGAKHIFE